MCVLAFPVVHDNDADIDSMANAAAYATLALGLNIVVGFAGLLDLGYAAFFAIGAYFYGIFTSFQVMPPWSELLGAVRRPRAGREDQPGRPRPACISPCRSGSRCRSPALRRGLLRRAVRRAHARLRGDYLAIVTLGFGEIVPIVARNADSVTNGAAGLNGVQAPRLFGWSFGVDATPYYYVGMALVALLIFVSIRLRDSPHRPGLDGDPRGRDRRRRHGRGPARGSSCWPSPSAPPSPA